MPGTFNSLITRTDASPLIPTDQAAQIIQALPQQSVALSLFRQVNMGTKITTLPVLDSLGQAYWVNGDTGLKQTTDVSWVGVDLVAEEIAAIVPVPDAVTADMSVSPWEAVRPLLVARIGAAIDAAVFAGVNKPPSWPTALIPAATAAGNSILADSTQANGGIATDMGEAFGVVELDGYDVSGVAAARSLRAMLRVTPRDRSSSTFRRARSRAFRSHGWAPARSERTISPSSAITRWPSSAFARTLRSRFSTRPS